MVLVTPEKMKNLPRSDPDTRPLPKLDIGRQSIFRNNRRARFSQRRKFLQSLGPLFSDLVIQVYSMTEGVSSAHFHSLVSSHWTSH